MQFRTFFQTLFILSLLCIPVFSTHLDQSSDLSSFLNQSRKEHDDENAFNIYQFATAKINQSMQGTSDIWVDASTPWSAKCTANICNLYNQTVHNGDAESENEFYWKNYERDQVDDDGLTRYLKGFNGLTAYSGNYSWMLNISDFDNSFHQVDYAGGGALHGNSVIVSVAFNMFSEENVRNSYSYVAVTYRFTTFLLQIYLWSFPHPLYLPKNDSNTVSMVLNDSWSGAWKRVSYNASKLGLEVCNKLPTYLWEVDIEVGFQDPPYSAIILFDDISSIDAIYPSEVDLKINNQLIYDSGIGQGSLFWNTTLTNNDSFHVSVNETNGGGYKTPKTWEISLELNVSSTLTPIVSWEQHNSTAIKWVIEFKSYTPPVENATAYLQIYMPLDWYFASLINPKRQQVKGSCTEINESIHQIVVPENVSTNGTWGLSAYSSNYIESVSPTSTSMTHDDSVDISTKLKRATGTINLTIVKTDTGEVFETRIAEPDIHGNAVFQGIMFSPQTPKSQFTVILKWYHNWEAGEQRTSIFLTTVPAEINMSSSRFEVNYSHQFQINLSYVDLENDVLIPGALVSYSWSYGQGKFYENLTSGKYSTNFHTNQIPPASSCQMTITATKTGYAKVIKNVTVFVKDAGFNVELIVPNKVFLGETVTVIAHVFDNCSDPLSNVTVFFYVNTLQVGTGVTNASGHASILYYLDEKTEDTLIFYCEVVNHGIVRATSFEVVQMSSFGSKESPLNQTILTGLGSSAIIISTAFYLRKRNSLSLDVKL